MRGSERSCLRHISRCFPNGVPPQPQPFSPAKPGEKGARGHPGAAVSSLSLVSFAPGFDVKRLRSSPTFASFRHLRQSTLPPSPTGKLDANGLFESNSAGNAVSNHHAGSNCRPVVPVFPVYTPIGVVVLVLAARRGRADDGKSRLTLSCDHRHAPETAKTAAHKNRCPYVIAPAGA